MNRLFYSLILWLLSPLILFFLYLKDRKTKGYLRRWPERFGFGSLVKTQVLLHCASMGETLAAIPLIQRLQKQYPQLGITVTTTSATSSDLVSKTFGSSVQHCYLPLDLSLCVSLFINKVSPKFCLLMERELWPNLLHQLDNVGCKTLLVNARLSQKSATQYRRWSGICAPMLASLSAIAAQTQTEAQRFIDLGVKPERIKVCGSLKFDLHIDPKLLIESQKLRQQWEAEQRPIWVAGSVHPGEFELVLKAHKALLHSFPQALLIMVPRHPQQFDAAACKIAEHKFRYVRRSEQGDIKAQTQVLLGDTMGELLTFYGAGDQAFVGGSIISGGGHNPLEPAALGLASTMGPNYWNFAEITELLQQAKALRLINSADDLAQSLLEYFESPSKLLAAKTAALGVVAQNRGAQEKQWALFEKQLSC